MTRLEPVQTFTEAQIKDAPWGTPTLHWAPVTEDTVIVIAAHVFRAVTENRPGIRPGLAVVEAGVRQALGMGMERQP